MMSTSPISFPKGHWQIKIRQRERNRKVEMEGIDIYLESVEALGEAR